ncbi:hypothetical protein O7A70_13700 [Mesorhizobium sp. Cs1299R1N1]|uniref:hypothetical protein n=1 Tax=Mesorhizobium sp. Cs1299R1N1 TaxID=3015172 RepID=UPI00301DD429
MPNTHVPAAGEAMPAVEGMQIITGRFSRRAMLIGAIASLPALGGAATAPMTRAVTMLADKPRRRSPRLARIEALLDTLPPEEAERHRAMFIDILERVVQMQKDGADDATIRGFISSLSRREKAA